METTYKFIIVAFLWDSNSNVEGRYKEIMFQNPIVHYNTWESCLRTLDTFPIVAINKEETALYIFACRKVPTT